MIKEQSLLDHLEDLRGHLWRSVLWILGGFILSWFFSQNIFDALRFPVSHHLGDTEGGLIFHAPADKFLAYVKVSFGMALVGSSPFWLYEMWRFIAPGLYKTEKKLFLLLLFLGTLLFSLGVSFVYFVVYPMAFDFLLNFGSPVDRPLLTIQGYLSFIFTTMIVFGLSFETPLVFFILGRMGVVTKKGLKKNRRYALLIIAVLSAFLTPPDVVSMFLMLGPLWLLYEFSIFLVKDKKSGE